MHIKGALFVLAVIAAVQAKQTAPPKQADRLLALIEDIEDYLEEYDAKRVEIRRLLSVPIDVNKWKKEVEDNGVELARVNHALITEVAEQSTKAGVNISGCKAKEGEIDSVVEVCEKNVTDCWPAMRSERLAEFSEVLEDHIHEVTTDVLNRAQNAGKECDDMKSPSCRINAAILFRQRLNIKAFKGEAKIATMTAFIESEAAHKSVCASMCYIAVNEIAANVLDCMKKRVKLAAAN